MLAPDLLDAAGELIAECVAAELARFDAQRDSGPRRLILTRAADRLDHTPAAVRMRASRGRLQTLGRAGACTCWRGRWTNWGNKLLRIICVIRTAGPVVRPFGQLRPRTTHATCSARSMRPVTLQGSTARAASASACMTYVTRSLPLRLLPGSRWPKAAALARHANPRVTAAVYAGLTDAARAGLGRNAGGRVRRLGRNVVRHAEADCRGAFGRLVQQLDALDVVKACDDYPGSVFLAVTAFDHRCENRGPGLNIGVCVARDEQVTRARCDPADVEALRVQVNPDDGVSAGAPELSDRFGQAVDPILRGGHIGPESAASWQRWQHLACARVFWRSLGRAALGSAMRPKRTHSQGRAR